MRKIISAIALLALLGQAAPAHASETRLWTTTASNWSIGIHDDTHECTARRRGQAGVKLLFGWNKKAGGVWIGFGHADWKNQIEKDKVYDITMITDGRSWKPFPYWGLVGDPDGAFISQGTFSLEFLGALAKGNQVQFWLGQTWLAKLNLDGSYEAIMQLLECQKAQDASNTQSSKQVPPPASANSNGPWIVPISRNGTLITLKARLNDGAATTFMLDTGATIVSIPQDMADRMGLKPIRYEDVRYGDGSVGREGVVIISRVALVTHDGGTVYLNNIEAMVGKVGAPLLIGKNFLDKFSSYQIDNRAAQLVLKR